MYNTRFLNKRASKNECYTWTSVLLLDSIVNVNKKCYHPVFSSECEYIASKEKIKIMSVINDKLFTDDFDDEEYDKCN